MPPTFKNAIKLLTNRLLIFFFKCLQSCQHVTVDVCVCAAWLLLCLVHIVRESIPSPWGICRSSLVGNINFRVSFYPSSTAINYIIWALKLYGIGTGIIIRERGEPRNLIFFTMSILIKLLLCYQVTTKLASTSPICAVLSKKKKKTSIRSWKSKQRDVEKCRPHVLYDKM